MRFRLSLMTLVLLVAVAAFAQTPSNSAVLARGKYLVEQAGQCQDCHSPRNQKGEFVREQWLQGGPILFKPSVPIPDWSEVALPIAGLPGMDQQEAVKFLMTGVDKGGQARRPPMPAYRFSRSDATAIVKYLKSLKPIPTAADTASK